MKSNKLIFVLISPLLLVTLIFFLFDQPRKPLLNAEMLDTMIEKYESGDVIFRRGTSLTSLSVNLIDRAAAYTHVGIMIVDNDVVKVIHVVPENAYGKPEQSTAIAEPLKQFLSHDGVVALSVQRVSKYHDPGIAARAASAATVLLENRVLFDSAFNLQTTDRMYCTELVWHAYKVAGVDLLSGIFDEIKSPFFTKKVIFTSTLLKSRYFTEVASATIH